MLRGLRGTRRAAIILVAAWVLTLGISVGRYDAASVVNGGPEWESFKSGKSPLHVGAIIGSSPETSIGVPYVFMYCSQGLDSADLCFSVAADSNPGKITFGVVASEPSDERLVLFRCGVRTVSVDWEKVRIGGKWILRARVPLGKIAVPHKDFFLSAKGHIQFMDPERNELTFETVREIHVDRSYYVVPGWAFLLYYNHF